MNTRSIVRIAAAIGFTAALLAPAAAQFWNPFGGSQPRQQPQRQQQQQPYSPFGGWFGGGSNQRQQQRARPQSHQGRSAPADYSSAPPAARKAPDTAAAVASPILVLGDGMADWLAYGLEDAFAERSEFGVVRKHRLYSGLVRYDPKRDIEWPQIARELVTSERPKFVVMMVGFHDRQPIRERTPGPPARPGAPAAQPAPADPESQDDSPESRAKASAAEQNAELQRATQPPAAAPQEPTRPAATGPMEFQSEAWQAAYVRRIDATIAALKTANVPVFWVGLPPQRNARQAADAVYLNELYRTRAERAGIVFIDIWDGFVDEAGRYVFQGPDFEGQTRRLRSADGIYFTRAGARKLAHYVEREILRSMISKATPVALPAPEPMVPQGRPGTAVRPLAGPVIPLTASFGGGGNELLGGNSSRPTGSDALATRVLIRGEPITAPAGRADNFGWPRGSAVTVQEPMAAAPIRPGRGATAAQPPQTQQAAPAAPAAPRAKGQGQPGEAKQPAPRRIAPRASNETAPRPPLSIIPR